MSDLMLCGILRMPPELWKDDPLQFVQVHSCMREAATELEQRADKITEAAALLDWLAGRLSVPDGEIGPFDDIAADCRAMAERLRK